MADYQFCRLQRRGRVAWLSVLFGVGNRESDRQLSHLVAGILTGICPRKICCLRPLVSTVPTP